MSDPSIIGLTTNISVNRGEPVKFKIKMDATNYQVRIYRIGYYGGLGDIHAPARPEPSPRGTTAPRHGEFGASTPAKRSHENLGGGTRVAVSLGGPLPAWVDCGSGPEGRAPVLKFNLNGATWRAEELVANATFTVEQADCDDVGNRDVGRDRIFITWSNAGGSTETDHLDLRYCD